MQGLSFDKNAQAPGSLQPLRWLRAQPRAASLRTGFSPIGSRVMLVVACLCTLTVCGWLGDPAAYLRDDVELAHLLRGMALIKCCLAIGAVLAVSWRFGWPISKAAASGYIVASAIMVGSTMLIWQLSFIVVAAVAFHLSAVYLVILGWREREPPGASPCAR